MGVDPGAAWGVAGGFHDVSGAWRPTSEQTLSAILAAMRAETGAPPAAAELPLFIEEGASAPVPEPELVTEDGRRLELRGSLPPDLPLGYHRLHGSRPGGRRLVVAPRRVQLPADLFGWGLAAQLYAVHSRGSQGVGDLADLAELGRWSRRLGARFVLLNPLHAALPGVPQEPSPYYPSSRLHINPVYLRVAENLELPASDLIDRDAVYAAKLAALEAEWERARGTAEAGLERFRREAPTLTAFGRFCALAEVHGRPWQTWPEELRHPGSAAVERFASERADRVAFHEWVQVRLDEQLAAAAREQSLVNDLAVGVHPDGFDAWLWQDCLAAGVSVGAPPDPFNDAGQDWGLPPFDPWRLAAMDFEPWRQTLRATLRHAAGIRVDHVMGLFRLFWIPVGTGPAEGAYVRYPSRELLDVLALESVRAGAFVVGEDLGTVQDEVREELRARGVLSYRLLWFEPGSPAQYPEQALAALTTHDLPTLMGVWTGGDPMPEVRERLARDLQLRDRDPEEKVVRAAHRLLAGAPSRLLALTLEDLAGARERPNLPGTTEPTNWSRRLPLSLEELERSRRARALAAILGRRNAD